MTKCKHCYSDNVVFTTNYEHLDPDDNWVSSNGWLCGDCECFHSEDGSYYGYYVDDTPASKVDYSQIYNN